MKYQCENELNTLEFKDFNVSEIYYRNEKFFILTNGGIARYNNSCNETLEERYIADTEISFLECEISSFYLEGAKYYNPDDVLIKEVEDKIIHKEDYISTIKQLKEGIIFFLKGNIENDRYITEIAIDVEEDTYWITLSATKCIIAFDRFMNRVMQ